MSSYPSIISVNTLSWKDKFCYSVGHVLNDLCASMWFTYLLVFFHYVLEFQDSLAGAVLLVGQIVDGLATPFVGIQIGSKIPFICTRNKCKGWYLFGTICVLFSFPFIFLPCLGCETSHQWAQFIYYSAFVVIFQIGWAAVQISHLTLIPILAKDDKSRTEITSYRYACTVISNIAVYLITWMTFGLSGGGEAQVSPNDVDKFQKIVFIAVGIGAVFSAIFFFGVTEDRTDELLSEDSSQENNNVKSILDWLKEGKFYKVALLYMSTRLFVNLSQVYLPLYLQDSLSLPSTTLATVPLSLFVAGFIASLIIRPMRTVMPKKVIFSLGVALGVAASVMVWFGDGDFYLKYGVYIVASLYGSGGSILLVMSLAITAALIGDNVKTGGFVYGAMSFTDKLSNGLAVFLIQSFHTQGEPTDSSRNYYKVVLSLVCGAAAILGLFSATPNSLDKCKRGETALANDESSESEPLLNPQRERQNYVST